MANYYIMRCIPAIHGVYWLENLKPHLRINYMSESASEIMLVMMITNQLVRECLCCTVEVTSKELQIEMKSH